MHLSESILILAALLALGIVASGLVRKAPIPYTVILVVIGIGVGELARRYPQFAAVRELSLTPDLVLFVFLPTLIFESGLKLDARQLIKDIIPVLILAIPALLVSTVVIGLGLRLVVPLDLIQCLLFGALISATDPVAVISLFRELGTPQRLTVLVEGESLLNDATAIVLFNILLGMALYGGGGLADILPAIWKFALVFAGGGLVGALFGIAASFCIVRFALAVNITMTLLMVTAYGAFIVAEHYLHLSGVMAAVVCAVCLGIFGLPKLAGGETRTLHETWDFLALLANTLLFILIGVSADIASLAARFDTICIVVFLMLAARAGIIYGLMPLAVRGFDLPGVSLGEKHIMWWGGLKGGLAIAIVLSIPDELPGKGLLMDLTLGAVMFTLMINAPSIRPLINWLGINRLDEQELEELKQGVLLARDSAHTILARFAAAGVVSGSGRRLAEGMVDRLLAGRAVPLSRENNLLYGRIKLLRAEMQELNSLYREGVIRQYTFLDLKGELRRKREHLKAGIPPSRKSVRGRRANLFLRFEDWLIRSLRERDVAAGLLAHYQNVRLAHHLIKDVAHILMSRAALDLLPGLDFLDREQQEEIRESYDRRGVLFSRNINETRRDFPEFYMRFESRLSCRAALAGALARADDELRHGGIGSKVFVRIQKTIETELDRIPAISEPVPELENRDLVSMVPLFKGLETHVLEELARQAQVLTFLPDDTIIGQGEHGSALYVIVRGQAGVYRRDGDKSESLIAVLGSGDFFGEAALLGDSVRTATVRALMESALLRITRKTIEETARLHPMVEERLEGALRVRKRAAE